MAEWFIGVDGGATKCVVRVEDEAGNLIGREIAGPANIRLSVPEAWQSILSALENILNPQQLSLHQTQHRFHAGMGLAGCEIKTAYEAFMQTSHPFATLKVTSDAETACLSAHAGQDGAIIIIGTGVVGFKRLQSQKIKIGGYGFPHDDRGGGAYLGLEAVHYALNVKDGYTQAGLLSDAVHAHFAHDWCRLIAWANQANSTAFATLAPLVIRSAEAGDEAALLLMQQAAAYITRLITLLTPQMELPLALIGGIAPFIHAYLSPALQSHITPSMASPDQGAIYLLRQEISFAKG